MRRKNITSEMMKQYIMEGLLLLMSKNNYDNISIGEITEKAGVNRSTYYRNFESKNDIIKYYFNQIIQELVEKSSHKILPLDEYLKEMFDHYYQYKSRLLLIHKAGLTHLILDSLNESFAEILEFKTVMELYEIYYHTGGIYNNFVLWFSKDMCETPEEMARIASSYLPKDFKPFVMRNI